MDRSGVTLVLDRQQFRRNQGIPTLTVLAGPVGPGIHLWKKWNGNRPVALPPRNSSLSPIAIWTATAITSGGLRAGAIRWLAKACNLSPSDAETRWSAHTPHDLCHALDCIPARTDTAAAVCRLLLAMERKVDFVDAGLIAESLCAESRARGESEEAFLAGVASLMSPDQCPAILFIPEQDKLEVSVQFICRLLGAAPTLPVALAIAADVAEIALRQSSDERWLAVLREGLVRIEGIKRQDILNRLETAGLAADDLSASLDILEAGGTSPDATDLFVETARVLKLEESEENEDRARSSAERFLFELLESLPQTTGRFQLNQPLEFRHGSKAAEADLLAADCKLVVEIDGSYYHLSSKDAYRRDRKKDWLFQQHGYRVLRFLADDVVTALEEILNTILAALDMCRTHPY